MKYKKIIGVIGFIAIIAISLSLYACEKPAPIEPKENQTVEPTGPVAELGDLVDIDFTLKLMNGSVVDTTDKQLAEKWGLDRYKIGTQKLILGQSGKVKGFDDAIMGVELGKTETKVIPPSQAVYELQINKTKKVHRFQPLNRKQAFKRSGFEKIFGKYPAERDAIYNFDRFPWMYRILNVSDDYVIAEMVVKQEESYHLPGMPWNSTVFEVYTDIVTFYHTPKEGQIIDTEFGKANITTTGKLVLINYMPVKGELLTKTANMGGITITKEFKIIKVTDKDFTIRQWGILEDKALEFTVTVKNLIKGVKDIKPNTIRERITSG
jgi:hypothetical protein